MDLGQGFQDLEQGMAQAMDNLSDEQLQRLMAEKSLASKSELAAATGVAERQIYRLKHKLHCIASNFTILIA